MKLYEILTSMSVAQPPIPTRLFKKVIKRKFPKKLKRKKLVDIIKLSLLINLIIMI